MAMDTSNFGSKLKPWRHWFLLAAIFFVGFSAVYLSSGPRLSDPDAWHYYRYVKWILEDGKIPANDPLQYYPEGGKPTGDSIVHSYLIAYTYKLIRPTGIDLMSYLMLFPAIFGGGLAAVALYFAVDQLFGRRTALFSALIYAFIPLSLGRVYSGTIDKEIVYGFFAYTSLYFFLKSYKQGISLNAPRSFVYPILAGIFYGLSYANWTGGAYLFLVIAVAAFLHYLFGLDVNLMKSITVASLVAPLSMHLIQPEKFGLAYFVSNANLLLPWAVSILPLAALVISDHLKTRGNDVHYFKVMGGIIFAVVFVLFITGEGSIASRAIMAPIGMLGLEKGAEADLYMATVAESQPSHFLGGGDTILQKILNGDFFRELALTLFAIPVGLILLLIRFKAKRDFYSAFAFVWIISGFIAANQGLRLLFFMAPSAAVITGYAFSDLYERVKNKEGEIRRILNSTSKKRVLQSAESSFTNIRIAQLALLVALLLTSLSTLNAAVAFRNFQSDLPKPWYDATMWMKENTPADSVMFFWWDYGYYFQALAERATISDGGGAVLRDVNLANMFSSPEDEAMKYITKYVDYEKTPTYMLVSYEEFGKSGAINRIAGGDPETGNARIEADGRTKDGQLYILNFQVPRIGDAKRDEQNLANALSGNNPYRMPFSTFYIANMGDSYMVWALVQFDQGGNYHPEWAEKLLAKLLTFNTGYGNGLKHFELVYQDQWNYVLIYKVK